MPSRGCFALGSLGGDGKSWWVSRRNLPEKSNGKTALLGALFWRFYKRFIIVIVNRFWPSVIELFVWFATKTTKTINFILNSIAIIFFNIHLND